MMRIELSERGKETIDNVAHPVHYAPRFATRPVECIDITRHLPFCLGNAFKYIWRAGSKGDKAKAIEDCRKALWYLNDELENPVQGRGVRRGKKRARKVFQWLSPDGSARYLALWCVLNKRGLLRHAEACVKGMIEEFEVRNER